MIGFCVIFKKISVFLYIIKFDFIAMLLTCNYNGSDNDCMQ